MPIDDAKRERLRAAGFVEMDVADWLGLDEIDRQVVELRVRLAREVRRRREAARLSQGALAERIEPGSAGRDEARPGDSLDQLASEFFATGGTIGELAAAIGRGG